MARNVVGSHKLTLDNSFNDWKKGTQPESANSYGDEFLKVLRQEFKFI